MAKPRVFVDTSGFYALLVRGDARHAQARRLLEDMRESGARAWTTDYIIDETATLLKARNLGHLCAGLFALLDEAQALVFSYVDEERFRRSRSFFEKHPDHGYSFTDYTSFVVMREFGITRALTKDGHFTEAGFEVLLPEE